MALKITEERGKIFLEGNINCATEQFLKQHIQFIEGISQLSNQNTRNNWRYSLIELDKKEI